VLRRLIAVSVLYAATANAQLGRFPRRSAEPRVWGGFTVGLTQPFTVSDGTTGSTWDFGSAIQYRATLEKTLQPGSSFGVAVGLTQTPLTYSGGVVGGCGSCDASANIYQVLALVHAGTGNGFHQVLELAGGATAYTNFQRSGGGTLPPDKPDYDLSFSFGYGFAYGLSPTSDIEVVQEVGTTIHQRTGLSASANNLPRIYVTRLGMRIGLGR
jgi:hypothetical protein